MCFQISQNQAVSSTVFFSNIEYRSKNTRYSEYRMKITHNVEYW